MFYVRAFFSLSPEHKRDANPTIPSSTLAPTASPAHQCQSYPVPLSPTTAVPSHLLTPTHHRHSQQAPASPIPVPSPIAPTSPRPKPALRASAVSLTASEEEGAEFVLQLAPRSSFASSADDLSLVSAAGSTLSGVVESQGVMCEQNDSGATTAVQDSKPACTAPLRGKRSFFLKKIATDMLMPTTLQALLSVSQLMKYEYCTEIGSRLWSWKLGCF